MSEINITAALNKAEWNAFIKHNYPPVGAFMQTWEWGEFSKSIGRKTERYFLHDGGELAASFTLVYHSLPFGLSYGYVPRGPVIAASRAPGLESINILRAIKRWSEQKLPGLIFLRLEPPVSQVSLGKNDDGFVIPDYYIQPRHNTGVCLEPNEENITASFHSSTRSNIRVAEKRGVTAEMKPTVTEADFDRFFDMVKDIIKRNGGKNPYPSRAYFHSLFKNVPTATEISDSSNLSIGAFYGYQHSRPAAIHFVLFFGNTATYLFGASYTDCLPSKVETYLHWATMREAKRRDMKFYDLGGIDENCWPTLTKFKRQFHGKEFHYVGNIDIPMRPAMYRAYNIFRKLNFSKFFLGKIKNYIRREHSNKHSA